MINIKSIAYDVELITETGARHLLNDALISLEWEDNESGLAARASLTLANAMVGTQRLASLAKINCVIQISARWNGGARQLMFDGTVWDWSYTDQNELSLVAYDRLVRLQQSKDNRYYRAGMTTQAIIGDICVAWSIPLSYTWNQSITHEKKTFNGETVSGMITKLLQEVYDRHGERYVALYRGGQLHIMNPGNNSTVYCLDENSTISVKDSQNINQLVTRVQILGRQPNSGRAPVEATVDGDLRFGVLQEIVRRDSNTLQEARREADSLLRSRGRPCETIQVTALDLPMLRKGDRIECQAGSLRGFFFVESVTHQATQKQMNLTLRRER
ncbi:MAG: hypothetical protein FWE40_04850 [Oscillospiraceae bacterium]|nr:hypothetical protein [Oscillospiraceae bacterium]